MTQTGPQTGPPTGPIDIGGDTGSTDWTGRTVRGRDGSRLGTLVEVLSGARGRWGVVRSVFGRRRMVPLDGAVDDGTGDLSVDADRASLRTAPALEDDAAAETAVTDELHRHYTGRGVLADAREYQHERYGGAKFGSAFFGWLVTVGVTVLLGVLGGAVTAALSVDGARSRTFVTLAVFAIGYYTGGYVAGREKGVLRVEGRDYVVQDGAVITIKV